MERTAEGVTYWQVPRIIVVFRAQALHAEWQKPIVTQLLPQKPEPCASALRCGNTVAPNATTNSKGIHRRRRGQYVDDLLRGQTQILEERRQGWRMVPVASGPGRPSAEHMPPSMHPASPPLVPAQPAGR